MSIEEILLGNITSEREMAGIIRVAACNSEDRPFLRHYEAVWNGIRNYSQEATDTKFLDYVMSEVLYISRCFPQVIQVTSFTAEDIPNWALLRDFSRRQSKVWKPCDTLFDIAPRLVALHEPHYPLSVEQSTNPKIAVYRTLADKLADKVTVMKLGRFLKSLGDMSDEDIIDVVNLVKKELKIYSSDALKWARTADDIIRVYNNGPRSCMNANNGGGELRSDPHPCAVYESPDIGIAYIEDATAPHFHVLARAVVNLKDKAYPLAYGDTNQLDVLLATEGFRRRDHALKGARIRYLEDKRYGEDAIILPYIDKGGLTADYDPDDSDYLVISRYGTLSASGTRGWSSNCAHAMQYDDDEYENLTRCDSCGEDVPEDTVRWVDSADEQVCEDCLSAYYIYAYVSNRSHHEEYIRAEDAVELDNNYYLDDQDVLEYHGYIKAEDTDNYHAADDVRWCERAGGYYYNTVEAFADEYDTAHFPCEELHTLSINLETEDLYMKEYVEDLPAEEQRAFVNARAYFIAHYWNEAHSKDTRQRLYCIPVFFNDAAHDIYYMVQAYIRKHKLCDIEASMQKYGYELDPTTWEWFIPDTHTDAATTTTDVTYSIAA